MAPKGATKPTESTTKKTVATGPKTEMTPKDATRPTESTTKKTVATGPKTEMASKGATEPTESTGPKTATTASTTNTKNVTATQTSMPVRSAVDSSNQPNPPLDVFDATCKAHIQALAISKASKLWVRNKGTTLEDVIQYENGELCLIKKNMRLKEPGDTTTVSDFLWRTLTVAKEMDKPHREITFEELFGRNGHGALYHENPDLSASFPPK